MLKDTGPHSQYTRVDMTGDTGKKPSYMVPQVVSHMTILEGSNADRLVPL